MSPLEADSGAAGRGQSSGVPVTAGHPGSPHRPSTPPVASVERSEARQDRGLPEGRARAGSIAQVISVVLCVAAITAYVQLGARPKARLKPQALPELAAGADASAKPAEPAPAPEAKATPAPAAAPIEPPAPPEIDRAAVAQAEALLDSASRDRARSDDRAAAAAGRLSQAASLAAADAARARKLAFRVRDPSTRVTQAAARGGFLKGEREKLQKELSRASKPSTTQVSLDLEQGPGSQARAEHRVSLRAAPQQDHLH